jgi:hypothetical protein
MTSGEVVLKVEHLTKRSVVLWPCRMCRSPLPRAGWSR